jgi:hypothetical protein
MRQLPKFPGLFAAVATLVLLSFTPVRGSIGASGADKVTIKRVFTGWKEGASFKRISEYFTGQEDTDDTVVLRTHPEQRSGFYFFIRVSNPGAPTPVKIKLELITPSDTKTKTFTFSSELKTGQNLFNLGLTAGDWPHEKAHPVAWKIDFVGSDNQVLVSRDSFLWEKPATP